MLNPMYFLPGPVNPLGLMHVYQCQRGTHHELGVVTTSQNGGERTILLRVRLRAASDTLPNHEK
jgi:hypothetical protein